jgi:RecB family endonuclease NucS
MKRILTKIREWLVRGMGIGPAAFKDTSHIKVEEVMEAFSIGKRAARFLLEMGLKQRKLSYDEATDSYSLNK